MHHSARDGIRRNNGESNITVPSVFKMQLFYMYRQTNAKISTIGTESLICIINDLKYNHRLILIQINSVTD